MRLRSRSGLRIHKPAMFNKKWPVTQVHAERWPSFIHEQKVTAIDWYTRHPLSLDEHISNLQRASTHGYFYALTLRECLPRRRFQYVTDNSDHSCTYPLLSADRTTSRPEEHFRLSLGPPSSRFS